MNVMRIFVSYETTDAAFATQLMTDLRGAGAEVITDNVGLEDTTFEQFLSEQLPQCQHLIVVQTPAALQSPRVRAVVDNALKLLQEGQMTAVLRVLAPDLNGVKVQAVPLRWAGTPEFDASQDYPRVLVRLCLHLGIGSNGAHGAPPPAASISPLGLPDAKEIKNKSFAADPSYAQRSAAEDRPLRPHRRYLHLQLNRRLLYLSLAIALILIVTSVMVVFMNQSAVPTVTRGNTPVVTPTLASFAHLEDDANQWKILSDQPGVTPTNVPDPTDVTTPSADGSALQSSFAGQGILVYRELPPADNAKTFELNLSFYLPSVAPITGLSFATGKLVNDQWWEWALQWLNSPNGGSWHIWDGNTWSNVQAMQRLSENTWHNLKLKGSVVNGQVHYISFSCDKVSRNLNRTFAPGTRSPGDHLAAFLELDGVQGSPYQVYTDKMDLRWN